MRPEEQTRVRLALPWLQPALRAVREAGGAVELPALEWLVARSDRCERVRSGWRQWLIEATSLPRDALDAHPAGPCLQALESDADSAAAAGHWACARPVHLIAALDHLRLAPIDDLRLPAPEAEELARDVDAHLADRGYRLAGHERATWSLRLPAPLECRSHDPADAVGQDLREWLPEGRDAAGIRSLMNELQMLLHEHPVNERRANRGLPPVNGLWLWGFGSAAPVTAARLPALRTDDEWLAGLWRLHGVGVRSLDSDWTGRPGDAGPTLFAQRHAPAADAREALQWAEARCFEHVRAALRERRAAVAHLLLGDVTLVIESAARLRFWRRARPLTEVLS